MPSVSLCSKPAISNEFGYTVTYRAPNHLTFKIDGIAVSTVICDSGYSSGYGSGYGSDRNCGIYFVIVEPVTATAVNVSKFSPNTAQQQLGQWINNLQTSFPGHVVMVGVLNFAWSNTLTDAMLSILGLNGPPCADFGYGSRHRSCR